MQFPNKSNVEPHPVAAEPGLKKGAAGPSDHRDPLEREPLLEDDEKLFDFDEVRAAVMFVVRAVLAYKVTAVATLVVVFGTVAALAVEWPKTYEADGRLLLQRNGVMASLVNPGRTIPRDAESPTLAAREIVLSRENVLGVMKTTNLLEEWQRTRVPLLRFKDWLVGLLRPRATEDEQIDALAGLIEDRLQVGTSDEGAVSFFIRWPDPQMAYRLVDEAMKSFLEYRRQTETAAISESIAILDRSVQNLEAQVTDTIAQLPRRPSQSAVRRQPQPIRPPVGPSPQSTVQLSRLKSELEAKQQDIARMTATRSQQLTEARGRLTTALTIYTEDHPTVLALRQTVDQLMRDSPELTAARQEARQLEEEYDALSVKVGVATEAAQARNALATASTIDPFSLVSLGDESDPMSLRLRVEISQLASVRERASAARAELASAEASFKYRYTVTRPPRVPRSPAGPNVQLIVLAGAIAGVFLAIGVPVARQLTGL